MTCEGTGACNQGRHPWCCDCGNLVTENSDGSSPHADMRSGIDKDYEVKTRMDWQDWFVFWFCVGIVAGLAVSMLWGWI